ncbi:uncharacterized protein F4807DRAFT_50696 [Annulohypoxylon truncatum]|uniref:uncharacterized protein n=1 Tax=Annulohypoxylon truncatum TaxID=327061 RepID=UPI002008D3D9|nr:uncharacterized protein F4807DRAFT_50696 [Annulohypoxylon truncatum]KAI1210512.1 hypothetical protein F4807DRAFT_50696 [Annulohypoxylon truncatum]
MARRTTASMLVSFTLGISFVSYGIHEGFSLGLLSFSFSFFSFLSRGWRGKVWRQSTLGRYIYILGWMTTAPALSITFSSSLPSISLGTVTICSPVFSLS